MDTHETIKILGPAFLGWQLWQLLSVIDVQGDELLRKHDQNAPSRASSAIMLLHRLGPQSVTELGRRLRMSHQLMAHRLKILKDAELVVFLLDSSDRRRKLIELSPSGRKEAKRLSRICMQAETAYQGLFDEIGIDLNDALTKAIDALEAVPLARRVK